ncbi:MAG: hypothetical protein WBX02_17275, partial [Terriglobales bacterium]
HYKNTLTVAGKSYSKTLDVKMDPRVKTTPADLRRQFELDRKIAGALHQDYEALQQLRSLRAQIKTLTSTPDAIQKAATDLQAKATTIEGEGGGYGARFLTTPEGRTLSRLNSGFGALVSALDTADAAPTTQQVEMFGELNKALEEQLSALADLKSKDIPALNQQLKTAGLPTINPEKPLPGASTEEEATTQDRDQNEE